MLVLLFHASADRLGGGWLKPLFAHLGTPGVITFFVLSGCVIAWTAEKREKNFVLYCTSRLARLWSVVIPALVLTYAADKIGLSQHPQIYPGWFQEDHPFERLGMSAVFLNQIWFLDIDPLSNTPFWSLCYEFWYYIAFGLFVLIRGRLGKALSICVALIMGPKIWLLWPIWLMGVAVYRLLNADIRLRTSIAVVFFLMPLALLCAYKLDRVWHLENLGISLFGDRVGHSRVFLPATIFGVAVALNILSFPSLEKYLAPLLMRIRVPIQWLAGATFSIYLFHHPLLNMFGAVAQVGEQSAFWVNLIILVFTLLCCIALSTVTEARKRPLRNLLLGALSSGRLLRGHVKLGHDSRSARFPDDVGNVSMSTAGGPESG